jgi:hypothetical protein
MISVIVCAPSPDLAEPWDELTARVPGNVFMNPASLMAAADTGFAKVHVLTAWSESDGTRRLVGWWALQERRALPLLPSLLESLPYNYAFTSNAVVEPAFVNSVISAFFDAIKRSPQLPNVVCLKSFDAESDVYAAMLRAFDGCGQGYRVLTRVARPTAGRDNGIKKSGSTRKKLRQDWNRLTTLGAAVLVNDREADAVVAAFEIFLTMEAASWKGEQGTALLCNSQDARFVRRLIGDLARQRNASVALLRINGEPIAAQVLLYCGAQAYTWKTAFDGRFGKFSPGALLIDKVTEALFEAGQVQSIDSCAAEDSFMGQLWTGRRVMADVLIDVGSRSSPAFVLEAVRLRGYERLRALRNQWRGRAIRAKRAKSAATAAL